MLDLVWLTAEAKDMHAFFVSIFYGLVAVLLALGIALEYLNISIGKIPNFPQLVGRVFIAAILLVAYPDISNTIASIGDMIADRVGDLSHWTLIYEKTKTTFKTVTWSWTSVGDIAIWVISYLLFFLLYVTVFFFNAAIVYCILTLYIFSPLIIAFYVLPQTAGAVKTLFQTLVEVVSWKICFSVFTTLIWSSALHNFKTDGQNFITVAAFSIMLILSIILTPLIVRSIISGSLASTASLLAGGSAAIMSAGYLTPAVLAGLAQNGIKKAATGSASLMKKGLQSTGRSVSKFASGFRGQSNTSTQAPSKFQQHEKLEQKLEKERDLWLKKNNREAVNGSEKNIENQSNLNNNYHNYSPSHPSAKKQKKLTKF